MVSIGLANYASAEKDWPSQPSLRVSWGWGFFIPPFGEKGKLHLIDTPGAYFFRSRAMLDKYREHPELVRQMVAMGECYFIAKGHQFLPLETMNVSSGRARVEGLGDGFVVLSWFTPDSRRK
jgi:hypothetical protein